MDSRSHIGPHGRKDRTGQVIAHLDGLESALSTRGADEIGMGSYPWSRSEREDISLVLARRGYYVSFSFFFLEACPLVMVMDGQGAQLRARRLEDSVPPGK